MRVLVVAAHPDDEILGCGATAARLVKEGHEVYFAIVAEGITSRFEKRETADKSSLAALQTCARNAAKAVGAKDIRFFGLPDNRLDSVPLLEVVKIVENLVKEIQPQVIYTHHSGDLNVDHGIVHRAVLTATRPGASQEVQEVYAFEVGSSTEWAFHNHDGAFQPNVFVEVGKMLETKIQALACYQSEIRPFPHPRSPEALRATALRWGTVAGCGAAEAFELVRDIRKAS